LELVIEIGDPQQKKLIELEMHPVFGVARDLNPPLNLTKVILAADFDAKVNELQGTTNYKSSRDDITASAKIVDINDGVAIVLSPMLFTEEEDSETRQFVYLHELMHAVNKRKFPPIPTDSYCMTTYLGNLHIFYDEYCADRIAYKIIDEIYPTRSPRMQAKIENELKHFTLLLNNPKYYDAIAREIRLFRRHMINIDGFLAIITPFFDTVSLSIVHAWTIAEQYPEIDGQDELSKSKFLNGKTLKLLAFLKTKYEKKSFDLKDGVDLVADFMENFGMRFEDRPQQPYCHVLDI
jgi:hypothetical protein